MPQKGPKVARALACSVRPLYRGKQQTVALIFPNLLGLELSFH